MSTEQASLGNRISEHGVRSTAVMGKLFSIVLTAIGGVFAILAFIQFNDEAVTGVPSIVYLGVGALFLVLAVVQVMMLMRLMGSQYVLYENGIQRVKGGTVQTWHYNQFTSILPAVKVYRLAMLIPIPIWRSYYYTLLGNSRATTVNIGPDYSDMNKMGQFLMQKLPQFSYSNYGQQ